MVVSYPSMSSDRAQKLCSCASFWLKRFREVSLDIPDWEIEIEADIDECWPADDDWEATARIAARAAHNVAPELAPSRLQVSVLFTSDAEVRALNRKWRTRDKPTNVLSFPMLSREDLLALGPDGPPVLLGDLAIAFETCDREASESGKTLWSHTTHLLIHGLLHLAGYDHEISTEDAGHMEGLEIQALASMGIADPYGDRDT